MQLEQWKVEGYRLLYLFKTIPAGLNAAPYAMSPLS